MLEDFDPTTIEDEGLRQVFITLMNLVESLSAKVTVQYIDFRTENITFRKEKYYSPSQKRTYLAEMPAGYHGQFGLGVRAWVLALYYASGMSEPKILGLLQTVGMSISAGQLSHL